MAPHSSTLAWKIPWTEEPGRLQSMGSRRVRHDWATSLSRFTFMHWRRKRQPTPVFLPWRIPGMGSHRVGHDWSDLAVAAVAAVAGKLTSQFTSKLQKRANYNWGACLRAKSGPPLCNPIDYSMPDYWSGLPFLGIEPAFLMFRRQVLYH